ncbi:Hypothetical protein SMAX5B_016402 [Scophthalmus maximus]|uniref:Uncharacterized protein n=1 Tax=Scophthalmus maximus TaxID=52904 RepID=A0A2U9C0W2_SCOMX|nr:Hypothetical protein SMAX5B_016402 [Scophthalmus maximus]
MDLGDAAQRLAGSEQTMEELRKDGDGVKTNVLHCVGESGLRGTERGRETRVTATSESEQEMEQGEREKPSGNEVSWGQPGTDPALLISFFSRLVQTTESYKEFRSGPLSSEGPQCAQRVESILVLFARGSDVNLQPREPQDPREEVAPSAGVEIRMEWTRDVRRPLLRKREQTSMKNLLPS